MPHVGFFRAVLQGATAEDCLARILDLVASLALALSSLVQVARLREQCQGLAAREAREHLTIQEFLKVRLSGILQAGIPLQILKARFLSKDQYHVEQLLNLAYKESKDEFEDPDDLNRKLFLYLEMLTRFVSRRVFVEKLFVGLKDWNFGLFIQEIFKQEVVEKEEVVTRCLEELGEEVESLDAPSLEAGLRGQFPHLSMDRLQQVVLATFGQNVNKIISRQEVRRKLLFLDMVGLCKQ